MEQILVVFRSSALSSSLAREAQDMAMALAAVGHQVSLLYQDEAVLQLIARNNSPAVKDFTVAQKLFPLYDIEQVYVCETSMQRFALQLADLRIHCQLAPAQLLTQFQHILVF